MLSIIIVTWNCREEVKACLETLKKFVNLSEGFETIIVDNASQDGTIDFLKDFETSPGTLNLKVVYNSRNVGLSSATEQAYRKARGDWVLLCNPDVQFGEGFHYFFEIASMHGDALIATEMVYCDGSPQRVIHRRFPTVTRVFFGFAYIGAYLDRQFMHHIVNSDYTYRNERFPVVANIEQPGASFLLLSRSVIRKLGLIFDPMFPVWWNDVDLSRRAEQAGIRRLLLTSVRTSHGMARGGSIQMASEPRRYYFCRSMVLYARRWRMWPRLTQLLFCLDAIAGIPLSVVVLQKKNRKLRNALIISSRHALSQVRGVLGA